MGRLRDRDLLRKNAYVGDQVRGTVHDFLIGSKGAKVVGIVVSKGWKSRTIPRRLFTFDGKRYVLAHESEGLNWKPPRGSAVKYSRAREKEVFAGPGWKIGRLNHFEINVEDMSITSLEAQVEHQLIMRDVGEYRRLREKTAPYDFKHFYKNAYSFRPDKIVAEMGDSDKARFLSNSGDSSIRGLGEATSNVVFPSEGMEIHEGGTILLPIDARQVQEITIEMVNRGELGTAEGRKNVMRSIFNEYYSRVARARAPSR